MYIVECFHYMQTNPNNSVRKKALIYIIVLDAKMQKLVK